MFDADWMGRKEVHSFTSDRAETIEQAVRRGVASIGMLAMLGACQHTEPGVEVRVIEKVVEVQRPCPGTVPERPSKLGQVPSDPVSALAIVAAKLAAYSGPGMYADQAEAYFEVCSKAE